MTRSLKPSLFVGIMTLCAALFVGGIIFWLVTTISISRMVNAPVEAAKSKIPALDVKSINAIFPGTLPEGAKK